MHTVLLIDDNPLQLRVREQLLRDAGFELHIATSGESALALMRTPVGKTVGAVVSDHLMPGLSGPELVRQLRAVHPAVPVLILSGLAEAEDEYCDLNIVFREKPCPPIELIQLLRRFVQRAA